MMRSTSGRMDVGWQLNSSQTSMKLNPKDVIFSILKNHFYQRFH
jgi:hypothetical protein